MGYQSIDKASLILSKDDKGKPVIQVIDGNGRVWGERKFEKGEIFRYIYNTLLERYGPLYIFTNPYEKNDYCREWGVFPEKIIEYNVIQDILDKILWLSPKLGSKQPDICIKYNSYIKGKLIGYNDFDQNATKYDLSIYGAKSNSLVIGTFKNSECRAVLQKYVTTGEWLHFFPNNIEDVELVFGFLEHIGKLRRTKEIIETKTDNVDSNVIGEKFNPVSLSSSDTGLKTLASEIEINNKTSEPTNSFAIYQYEEDYETEFEAYQDGEVKQITQIQYERNPKNREICIRHYQKNHNGRIICEVCGFDFEEQYGERGRGYIEVHHKNPVSQLNGSVVIDPKNDLVPLCSNCHSMIHAKSDNMTIDDLRELFKK